MKTLICAKEVQALAQKGEKIMYVDADTLITPAARDAAAECGVEFCDSPAPAATPCCEAAPAAAPEASCSQTGNGIDKDVIYQALQALMANGQLGQLMSAIGQDVPYVSESEGGVKLVRSNTAQWLPLFEEGELVDKVFYNELINADDGSQMNAGFITIDNCSFPWETACQEIYYVAEGTLEITRGCKKFVAKAGDVMFFEKGENLTFGSPDKMKAFYVTH